MVIFKSWAAAFVNSLEKEGADFEEGLDTFLALASWAAAQPSPVSGRAVAEKLEARIRGGIAEGGSRDGSVGSRESANARETALRFFLLMVKKHKTKYFDSVSAEIKRLIDEKRGIVALGAEYAFEPDEGLKSRVSEALKKRAGAEKAEITWSHRPELIGGYRLRIGDEVIDASLRAQLQKMERRLASGGA